MQVTFENFAVARDSVYQIGATGANGADGTGGVIQDMAQAFGYQLSDRPDVDNLRGFITAIGPGKELRDNLPLVQERLGTEADAMSLARGWVERSGLLAPVQRGFLDPETQVGQDIGCMLITGGVRNWMQRRAARAISFAGEGSGTEAILVAGSRPMKPAEGPDVIDGMTEAVYADRVLKPLLQDVDISVQIVAVVGSKGSEVAAAAAAAVAPYAHEGRPIAVIGNAGNWPQNAGSVRRALRSALPSFDDDGSQLMVISDGFPLGETGVEPPATHQHPLTALGIIARNAQELVRH